ncbi:MAG: DNA-directed RNA polymerase subunit alpha [Chloroflexi bacterium]|nr:DNA-directed RNA polymerase subunit alpha [Chloroflexota bacterium]
MVTPEIRAEILTDAYGRFVAEPLVSGYGTTLGNALRRVLLSSLSGAAVTWVRIDEVQHEFSTVPHMREDVIEFLLNVKELRLRSITDRPGKLYLEVTGEGRVTAADIKPSADFEIVNPELQLATLDAPDASLTVEFNVERGEGFVSAGLTNGQPIGVIPVDAVFTPIRRVSYTIENTRVEQVTNFDRLVLEVWTDGTIAPQEAVSRSAETLMEQLTFFRTLGQPPRREAAKPSLRASTVPPEVYDMPIEDLNLSVRAYNALKRNNITKLGQILEKSEEELLHIRNFGDKSLAELRERLSALGISMPEEAAEEAVPEELPSLLTGANGSQLPQDQLAKLARLREELSTTASEEDEEPGDLGEEDEEFDDLGENEDDSEEDEG